MAPARNHRLTGDGQSSLLQLWTTVRLRVFLRAAASKRELSQSAFVREAIWQAIERTLTPAEFRRCEAEATREIQEERKIK
jgi:hypothetical protein